MSELAVIDEYIVQQQKILTAMTELESKDFETKKQYIIRLKEVTRPIIMAGYYDGYELPDLAIKVYELLDTNKVSYPRNDSYYSLFDKDETRQDQNRYNLSTSSRQKITSLPLEEQTGKKEIDRFKQLMRFDVKEPHDYDYSQWLKKVKEVSNEINKQVDSLLNKLGKAYFFTHHYETRFPSEVEWKEIISMSSATDKKEWEEIKTHYLNGLQIIEDIESVIDPVKEMEKLDLVLSMQRHTSKQIDERSKITFLEKWNIISAQIELGISAIAKKIGINKKHISNNIRPAENPVTGQENKHHQYIDWFRAIQVISPNGDKFVFDAKEYFDKQIERGKLNIPFQTLVLKNCELE